MAPVAGSPGTYSSVNMKKTTTGRFAAVLIALTFPFGAAEPTALAQPSAGDVAQARELFNQGLALRDKGDLAGAIEKLRAAHALASTPITGIELGRTYASSGKLVEAREAFLSVGRLPVSPQETAHSARARVDAAQLAEQVRPRIPSLLVKVTGVPLESVAVTLDGAAVPPEALTAPRLVNPGSHELVATSTSGGSAKTTVDVKEGEARTVELKIVFSAGTPTRPAPPAEPAAVPSVAGSPDAGGAGQPSALPSVMAFGGFGLAGVGIVAGSVTGVMALSKGASVKNACDGLTCPRSVDGDLSSGRTLATVSTISFVAAGVGAALGVTGLLLRPHQESAPASTAWVTPWVGPGSAGVSGALRF
jgi:hypothetical protein